MNNVNPDHFRVKREYFSRRCEGIRCHKTPGFIASHVLINTGNYLTFMYFTYVIQRWGLDSLNINTVGTFIQLIDVFTSLMSFTSPVELVLCLFSSYSIDHTLFQSLCLICLIFWSCLVFIDFLNACYYPPVRYICLWCTGDIHTYNRHLNIGMIWCKIKLPPLFWLKELPL